MKISIKSLTLLLITGSIIHISCKKDMACENCSPNPPGSTNRPPSANAGPDKTIMLPINSTTLDGNASSDPDGSISEWAWRKISGPDTFTIVNAAVAQTVVKDLATGVYQFELKVTDAGSLFDTDTITITVNPASPNSYWTALSGPPSVGIETFIIGIDMDNVFVGDGYYHKFYKYNYPTNSWVTKANVPGQAFDYQVNFAVGGKGYTGMGMNLNTPHNEMYQYDPVTDQWTQKNNSPLSGYAIPLPINNFVYLAKGPHLWMYNPVTDSYTQKNNIPVGGGQTSFIINDTGYIITGTAECWKYNTASDSWQQKASLPGYLYVEAGFTLNNYGYVLGDSSRATYNLNYPLQLWRYNPVQNQWQRIYKDYPGNGAYLIKTISLNGFVYVGFGYNNADWPDADFWKFQ